jgi:4-aminobutyrate aminotransferase
VLLIDDEVQAGMGRTGKWFAIEHWGVEPDILCSAKALASGLPLGATIAKTKIMDWSGGSHASTFGGNPLSCVAASAVIDTIKEEKLLENATKQGAHILKRLEDLKEKCAIVGDVRGKGLMVGMEIVEDKESKKPSPEKSSQIMERSWKRGIAVIVCGVSTIRIMPPLNITRDLVDSAMDIIEDVTEEVAKQA